jgi:PAS domain S-box-containing protein
MRGTTRRSGLARLALVPMVVVLLLTGALLVLAQNLVVGELERRTLLRNQYRASVLAQQIDATLQSVVRELRVLARSPLLRQPESGGAVRAELEHLQRLAPHVAWIGLVTPDGVVRSGTQGWLEGRSIAERPVFLHGMRGAWLGDVHPAVALAALLEARGDRATELLDVAEPVRDAQGRIVAVLAAHLGVEWVDRLRASAIGEAEGAAVPAMRVLVISTAAERSVLADEVPPEGLPLRVVPPAEVRAADGTRYLAATREIGSPTLTLPWRVLVLQERDAALRPAHAVMRSMLGLGGLAALAAGLLGYLLSRRLLSPWTPVFEGVLRRVQPAAGGHVGDADLRAFAEELQRAAPADGPEALLARLARDARDLKRALDHLPLGVALIDRSLHVEYVTAGYTRLLGWTTGQVRGRLAADFLWDAAERPASARLFGQLGTPAGEVVARFDALTPDGGRVPVQWHLVPLNAEDGRLEGAIALVHDIRGERAAQARADAMAGRLRALADAANADLLATLDHEGRVLEWSRGAERLSGHASAQALGRPLAALLPPADVASWARQALREGRCHVSAELSTADGRPRWFEGSLYALGLAPGSARHGLILRDVSERVGHERALESAHAEMALLARRLLEQEKETTRRLALALHDELGQTLSALRLQWEGMVARDAVPQGLDQLGTLVATANRQVRGVLGELRPPMLDEAGLVAAIENELSQQGAREGGPRLALAVPPRLQRQRWPADVEYAAFMIGREALLNALQHAQARRVDLRLEGDEGELVLVVADDGIGIGDLAGGVRPGHLGLVGMRERALAIGATMDIASEPGLGTVVRLNWEPADEPDLSGR